jgi:hypothetical protein
VSLEILLYFIVLVACGGAISDLLM